METLSPRAALEAAMIEQGLGFAELSRVIGRNPAYLQQYVRRGTPRVLAETDRARLARYLSVPEAQLGGPEPVGLIEVARLDVGASAGPGRIAPDDRLRAPGAFSPAQLRALGVRPQAASMIRVEGDSMEPTLADGDEILVDRDRCEVRGRGTIFVIRLDGVLMVKRLRLAVGGIEVISDNAAYPLRLCRAAELEVLGQVAWLGRALV